MAPGVVAIIERGGDDDDGAVATAGPVVFARCGERCLNAEVATFTAVSESILTGFGRSFGGG